MQDMTLAALCQTLLRSDQEVEVLEMSLAEAKEARDHLREVIADRFVQEGVQNIKDGDGHTFYLRRDIYVNKAKDVDASEVIAAMLQMGLEDFVKTTYDPQKLKAWIRERDAENPEPRPIEDSIPKELVGLINAGEITRVICKGGK